MHYGATNFGGHSFTIVPKDLDYLAVIGRNRNDAAADLTYTDVTIVNKMYRCNINAAPTSCPKIPCTSKYSSSTCDYLRKISSKGYTFPPLSLPPLSLSIFLSFFNLINNIY